MTYHQIGRGIATVATAVGVAGVLALGLTACGKSEDRPGGGLGLDRALPRVPMKRQKEQQQEREKHGPGLYNSTTERSTSPRCILANASSTSPRPMRSETNMSRSSRPCR